jgi:hypothetical protein
VQRHARSERLLREPADRINGTLVVATTNRIAAVPLVIGELLMAVTDLHDRPNPTGAVMSVLTIPIMLSATRALVRFPA